MRSDFFAWLLYFVVDMVFFGGMERSPSRWFTRLVGRYEVLMHLGKKKSLPHCLAILA